MTEPLDEQIETIRTWTNVNITDVALRERIQQSATALINTFMDIELPTRNNYDIEIMSSTSYVALSLIRYVRDDSDGELQVFRITYSTDFYQAPDEPPRRLELTKKEKNRRAMDDLTGRLKAERYTRSPMGRASTQYIAAHRGSEPWERGSFEERGNPHLWGFNGGVLIEISLDTYQMTALCRHV